MDMLGLYIHIPFCLRKCEYCNFISYPDRLDCIDRYIDALIDETRLYETLLQKRIVDSVFIGGGTPSLLLPEQIERLIHALRSLSTWENAEVTVEANPETLDGDKLAAYAELGVNRLSMGLQTHENNVLRDIGRRHTWETFLNAYEAANRYFNNINVDIIFGLPEQTVCGFNETLSRLIELSPMHLSAYALKLESGTPLSTRFDGIDEDTDRQMYHLAAERLTAEGYTHYETSNFAKNGCECKHNLKYWMGEEYLGLGVAAYSYLKEDGYHRFGNTPSIDEYFRYMEEKKKPIVEDEHLSQTDKVMEYIMLRLRLKQGICFQDYTNHFQRDFFDDYNEAIIKTENAGLIERDEYGIRPTLKGFDIQNALIGEFIKKL